MGLVVSSSLMTTVGVVSLMALSILSYAFMRNKYAKHMFSLEKGGFKRRDIGGRANRDLALSLLVGTVISFVNPYMALIGITLLAYFTYDSANHMEKYVVLNRVIARNPRIQDAAKTLLEQFRYPQRA
jgi:threonine/homoserine/homoserine lactone efflux protein